MLGRPQPTEAASYYYTYIDRVPGDDIVDVLGRQLEESVDFLSEISEERSLHRYAPDKWSIRELLGHINDTERVFLFRAHWYFVKGIVGLAPIGRGPTIVEIFDGAVSLAKPLVKLRLGLRIDHRWWRLRAGGDC